MYEPYVCRSHNQPAVSRVATKLMLITTVGAPGRHIIRTREVLRCGHFAMITTSDFSQKVILTSSGEHAVPGRRRSRPFFAMLRTALVELDIVHELVLTKWPVVGVEDLFFRERHQDP